MVSLKQTDHVSPVVWLALCVVAFQASPRSLCTSLNTAADPGWPVLGHRTDPDAGRRRGPTKASGQASVQGLAGAGQTAGCLPARRRGWQAVRNSARAFACVSLPF